MLSKNIFDSSDLQNKFDIKQRGKKIFKNQSNDSNKIFTIPILLKLHDHIKLNNENIDIINWTNNIQLLIQRSLTPAKVSYMELDDDKKHAEVFLKPDQVSLAIGRRGTNIKLACELTGYDIDVYRDNEGEVEEFDIDLEEFNDEIDSWIIDELKRIGCDTARSVLNLTEEELERRTDLEKETISDVKRILQEEFEKE